MPILRYFFAIGLLLTLAIPSSQATPPGQYRLHLTPDMLLGESSGADYTGLVDEQQDVGDPPSAEASGNWKFNPPDAKSFPHSVVIELDQETPLATLWLYDSNGRGEVKVEVGDAAGWTEVASHDGKGFNNWVALPIERIAKHVRLTVMSGGANFSEIALDAYSQNGWAKVEAAKAEEKRLATEQADALKQAREEALKRPLIESPIYGTLSLVDEVDLGAVDPGHLMEVDGKNEPELTTILGRKCRVLPKTEGEATFFTVRLGQMKLLRPGAAYVLVVDYPEDEARSVIIRNTGNDTTRGFHTGLAVGDALRAKYVNNYTESLDLPLSGKWEQWSQLFWLHDSFHKVNPKRRQPTPRDLGPEDGFNVTVAQFSAKNIPLSQGAAVARIALYEVVDPEKLKLAINYPPEGLPRRHIFWREEMADGVITGKTPADRGVADRLDWYRYKVDLMKFLGMDTFSKDLLEFGANQGWDSAPHGGNDWVYTNGSLKGLWPGIVDVMGKAGVSLLPYYEYSGSKGKNGLGNERRAKPLTRDDGFTHIKWVDSANADLTDPDTLEDFCKMLDITVVREADKAHFLGIWLRPRSQMPIGFGPKTLERFSQEANDGKKITREQLKSNQDLYDRYIAWWETKRRDFLVGVRDYLRDNGLKDAIVLYTGDPSEPGVFFPDWSPRFVTERVDLWEPILGSEAYAPSNNAKWRILTPDQVASEGLLMKGLTSPGLNWGDWEIHHARPADDPANYKDVEGVLLSHPFNRLFTVNDPRTLDLFRSPTGLAMLRYYSLNENMLFDREDNPKLGYFVADMERAGPYSMQSEAVAMANGDPTMIGYLSGNNFARGFPEYVRDFNANFLALPALPSERLDAVASEEDVVVRQIKTPANGSYFTIVNTAPTARNGVRVALPGLGASATMAATGAKADVQDGALTLDLRPYQLVSIHNPE